MKRLSAILATGALFCAGLTVAAPAGMAVGGAGGVVQCTGPATATVGQPYVVRWKVTPNTGFILDAGQLVVIRAGTQVVGSPDPNALGVTEGDVSFSPTSAGVVNVTCLYTFVDGSNSRSELETSRFSTTVNAAPAPPALTSMAPATATERGGGTAEIVGTNLAGTTSATIGGRTVSVVSSSDTKVVVAIPGAGTNPVGTAVDVTVTTPLGTATLPAAFTYTSNPPSIGPVSPSCGVQAGTPLTITGNRLTGATSVTVGGVAVAFSVTNGSTITVPAAPALADVQSVVVTTPAGSSSGLATVSYRPCSDLPPVSLAVTSTVPAGGFATIQWSFPAGDPNLTNVAGLQYALNRGGPYTNVGGTRSGTTGSFTVGGLTKSPILVFVKTVNVNPALGQDSVTAVGVRFASAPTALPPNTGNAGSVAPPAAPTGTASPGGSDAGGGADPAAADAPCLAPVGDLYPTGQGTVGSQLLIAPGRPGQPTPTNMTVTGGALPPGIGLDSFTGIALGVPTAAGQYSATVAGRYPDGSRVTGTLAITIANDAQTLTYPAIVVGVVGKSVAAGPTTNAPVGSTYEIVCGTVPPGTTFDTRTGVISGTPTAEDLENPPLRIVERNAAGSAAASFAFVVIADGGPQISYPAHPHLRAHTRARVHPTVVDSREIAYFKVIRGKLNRGLRLNHTTGVITGRPARATGNRPHHVTIAAVLIDGTLLAANPMTLTVRHHRR